MILETNIVQVAADNADAFEAAFAEAASLIGAAPGCHDVQLIRQIEAPGSYWVIVGWASLEDHTETYAESPEAARVRELIGPYVTGMTRGHGCEVPLA